MRPSTFCRLSDGEIRSLVAEDFGLTPEITDEMAIPSYLHPNPLVRWLFWRRYSRLAELAALRPDMTVLEFGCGIGVFLPTLCAGAGRVLATDLFPQYAKRLVERRGLAVTFVDSADAVPGDSLDLIVAADVLEHVPDLETYLEQFRAQLRAGGRLLVSGPTESRVYRLGRIVAGFGDKGAYHLTDIRKLRRSISAAGFVPARTRYLPFALPPHLFEVIEFLRA